MRHRIVLILLAFGLTLPASKAEAGLTACDLAFGGIIVDSYRETIVERAQDYPLLAKYQWPVVNRVGISDVFDGMQWRYLAHRALLDADSPFHSSLIEGYFRFSAVRGDSAAMFNIFTDFVHRRLTDSIAKRAIDSYRELQNLHESDPTIQLIVRGPHVHQEDVEEALAAVMELPAD